MKGEARKSEWEQNQKQTAAILARSHGCPFFAVIVYSPNEQAAVLPETVSGFQILVLKKKLQVGADQRGVLGED